MELCAQPEEDRLQRFLRWLQANGVQLRICTIKETERSGLGVFSTSDNVEGVLMVTPLHLAITPMSVLQDPELGKAYAKLFEDGDVDDRLLMILFLLVERMRGSPSLWAPYLDVLPRSFGTPLWFTKEEFEELKGTALYNATNIQLKNLKALFADKAKPFAEQLLTSVGVLERKIDFQDFLWANCIFWTRALNIPCPHSFVFPMDMGNADSGSHEKCLSAEPESCVSKENIPNLSNEVCHSGAAQDQTYRPNNNEAVEKQSTPIENDPQTVWVEGLVPGIDFCNHAPRGVAHWEVDGPHGSATGIPNSMYLKTVPDLHLSSDTEIRICYGNKGNEELLFLYGFVIEDNPDDYFMVHFPKEALDRDSCGEAKVQLLEEQNLTLRWLLPGALLRKGFFSSKIVEPADACINSFSWSGDRQPPSYVNRCVFPEETMAALRVVAMKENELQHVVSMLQELSRSRPQWAPTGEDARAAIWEVCGNAGALQLLTDLIATRVMNLEEGTGTEDVDKEILESLCQEQHAKSNIRSCVIYRKGQKYLAKAFLKEAEHLLELCLSEEDRRGQADQPKPTKA